MPRRLPYAVSLAAAFLLLAARSAPTARADAVAMPKDGKVDVTTEYALVIWDAASKTEYLIRDTMFSTTSPEFAYLVPTPTKPEVAPADDGAFRVLSEVTRPKTVVVPKYQDPEITWGRLIPPKSAFFWNNSNQAQRTQQPAPEEKKLADIPYFVMKADEPDAVRKWLESNGCEVRPDLTEWLKWYADNKWYVTGIKVTANPPRGSDKAAPGVETSASTSTVRLSFKTDRPVFPHREPTDQHTSQPSAGYPRLLRLYVMSDARTDAVAGDGSRPWPGKVVWANTMNVQYTDKVVAKGKLPDGVAGKEWSLTEFEDLTTPRAGTDDLSIRPAADQGKVERNPYVVNQYKEWPPAWVVYSAIFSVPGVAVVGGGYYAWRRSRLRKAAAAAKADHAHDELL